jgi:hypothetical protein
VEPTSGQVHNPSLQPRNEHVVKYGEQRHEGVRSMPKEADPWSKIPARGQAFENLSRWRRVQAQVVHQDRSCNNTRKRSRSNDRDAQQREDQSP